ncbi:MAG: hypothetical protein RTU63_10980 [Candidatus Thorarchaeota archaeon]
MYEEIDTSGQTKWILSTIIGFVVIVGLAIVRFFAMPLGDPPFNDQMDLVAIIGFTPMAACLLGSLFGALRKMAIKINPDRLEFTSDVKKLKDFGLVYYTEDFKKVELGGNPAYMCGWAFSVIISMCLGFMLLFGMDTIGSFVGSIVEVSVTGIMYVAGVYFAYRGGYIRNKMVKNPLDFRITKYLTKYDVLGSIARCDLVSEIIVRYKIGKGQALMAIDDIHVMAVTSTEPEMEVEITIQRMENLGPEYTYYFPEGLSTRKEETIDVDGKDTILIVDEVDMKSFIRVRYDMNRIRARWNLADDGSICELMHAFVDEVSKYMPVTKVPKIEDSALSE